MSAVPAVMLAPTWHAYMDVPCSSMDQQQSLRTPLYTTSRKEPSPPDWAGSLTLSSMLPISAPGHVRELRDAQIRRLPVHQHQGCWL